MQRQGWHVSARTARPLAVLVAVLMTTGLLGQQPAAAASGDLTVALTPVSSSAVQGSTITVNGTVTNPSTDESGEVQLYVSTGATIALSAPGASCSTYSCTAPSLAPGATLTLTIVLTLDAVGPLALELTAYPCVQCGPATASIDVTAPPSAVTLGVDRSRIVAGRSVTLTALATSAIGGELYGEVVLFARKAGDPAQIEVARQRVYGPAARFEQSPLARTTYTASYIGSAALPSTSPPVVVEVGFGVSSRVAPTAVPPGSPLTVDVTVVPAVLGGVVIVDQRVGSGAWRRVAVRRQSSRGTVRLNVVAGAALGVHTYRATVAGDAARLAGVGQGAGTITVTGRGNPGAWASLGGTRARPLRWNPCAPITYYLNLRNAPATSLADVREAARRISLVSGLPLRYGGTTSRAPGETPSGPGTILIAWVRPTDRFGLPTGVAGVGSFVSDGRRIFAGQVRINQGYTATAPAGFGAGLPQGAVLMHELAHVVGLGHVTEAWSVMQPVGGALPASVWSAGDITGLRAVGRRSGCL